MINLYGNMNSGVLFHSVVCAFFMQILISGYRERLNMQDKKWISMKEVCEYLHISRDTVISWINKEGMPAHKKGRLWRFDVNEVDEWMKTNESKNHE